MLKPKRFQEQTPKSTTHAGGRRGGGRASSQSLLLNRQGPPPISLSLSPALQPKLKVGSPGDEFEQEADRVAAQVMRMPDPSAAATSAAMAHAAAPAPKVEARAGPTLQRQPNPQPSPPQTPQQEFDAERRTFERGQADYFEDVGEIMRQSILERAGIERARQPSTAEDALQVVRLWGLGIADIVSHLPNLGQSMAPSLRGTRTDDQGLAQRQQTLIDAMTPAGRAAYQRMFELVRAEHFWRDYLATHNVFVLPDLTGGNRFGGFTEKGTRTTPEGQTTTVFVIHLSKTQLEAGQSELMAALLVHELSHTLIEPAIVAESLNPFVRSLANLIADHPQVAALRNGAPDPAAARQTHFRSIFQMLYERTGYAEEEIFVHLQQLTHQPDMEMTTAQGATSQVRSSEFILQRVELFIGRLRRIGLPPLMLRGIIGSISRRVALLYDRRIAAAPANSRERQLLEVNKRLAIQILGLALTAR